MGSETKITVGARVKFFRQRRDGSFHHGVVVSLDPGGKWCCVNWDGRGKGTVMTDCLLGSDQQTRGEAEALKDCAVVWNPGWPR